MTNETIEWVIGDRFEGITPWGTPKKKLIEALFSSVGGNFIVLIKTSGGEDLRWRTIDGTKILHDFARDQTLNVARLPEYRETSDANIKRTALAIVSETAKSAGWRAAWNSGCDAERGPAYDRAYHAAIEDANTRLTALVMQVHQGAGR